ncbi:MAG: two pore domain potassium channel family protein [Deltaproteobacteria bacterium]|nr:MAG: two pore domain potassium channel family protein [Deltaproteobacteria bacterium]
MSDTESSLLKIIHRILLTIVDWTMVKVYRLFGLKKEDVRMKHAEIYLVVTSLFIIALVAGYNLLPTITWLGWIVLGFGNLRVVQILSLNLLTILFDQSPTHRKPQEARVRWHMIALGFSFFDIIMVFTLMYQFLNDQFHILNDKHLSFIDSFYYATMTMTTIGYGDIHPVNDLGKILSTYQAVVALFFLIFAVSGAISRLHRASHAHHEEITNY